MFAACDIVCQQEVSWIYNYVPKAQQVSYEGGYQKNYNSVSDSI